MAKTESIEELFLDELRDLYDAEKQITKALPKLAKGASSDELRTAFEEHLQQTQNQVRRLEQIFENLGEKATGKKCAAMAGLLHEGDEMLSEHEEGAVRDAGLIGGAQKVEHYEIAGYGTARSHAELLGNDMAVKLLEETLNEEKETDEKLNEIAENVVNQEAYSGSSEDEEEETAAPMKAKSAGSGGSGSARKKSATHAKTKSAGHNKGR